MADQVFTKRAVAPPGFFEVEAAGLRWLDVPGGVAVAEVVSVDGNHISLRRVPTAPARPATASRFGAQLAITHDAGAPAFGCPPAGWAADGYIGDLALSLRPAPTWGEFYAAQRVLPYARQAHRDGALTTAELRLIESVTERIGAGEFDDPAPPARIHGDLWAGNVLFGPEGVVLIDPAAHGGHRLTDLAMLALFGLPHLAEVFAAYQARSNFLPPSWTELLGLHQLHPLLVHAVLFGGSYGRQAAALAAKYGPR